MKTLYIDCGMGAAGDMLAAALLELTPDPEAAVGRLNAMGIPGVVYEMERTSRCGIAATRLVVKVGGVEECAHHHHGDHHHHDCGDHYDGENHHHHHHHEHRSLADMLGIVDSLALPENVKSDVAEVYRIIADAESRAHGRPVGEVHFHEVGALDAVADISAVCRLISELAPDEVVASPVNVGGGTVRCAHGTLPVPAPATARILEGLPSYGDGEVLRELCTPTGAALLRRFARRFGPMPAMRVSGTGYGAGSMEFEGRANLLRCAIGESGEAAGIDEVREIACNIDDMTGEELAFACERIFEAGALDVATLPATMKKGRPGVVMLALCRGERRDAVVEAIFRHTTTIGVREHVCQRHVLTRREDSVALPDGAVVRRKTSEGFGVVRTKFEHDDVASYALSGGISLMDAVSRLTKAAEI